MRLPLKLSDIDQEHLQEVYDAAGVARDDLPFSPAFDTIVQEFQDRTFKNGHPEQVFGALLKYTRTGVSPARETVTGPLTPELLKQLKGLLPRHAKGGKLMPYSDEFEAAHKEFSRLSNTTLSTREFWMEVVRSNGSRRPPPVRKKVAAKKDDDDIE